MKGQTSVEYILMVLAVLIITFSVMERVRAFFLPPGEECTAGDTSLACAFERLYNNENLKYYRFPK